MGVPLRPAAFLRDLIMRMRTKLEIASLSYRVASPAARLPEGYRSEETRTQLALPVHGRGRDYSVSEPLLVPARVR
jgi:hypothetical protein